jgi:hypothetical protein
VGKGALVRASDDRKAEMLDIPFRGGPDIGEVDGEVFEFHEKKRMPCGIPSGVKARGSQRGASITRDEWASKGMRKHQKG